MTKRPVSPDYDNQHHKRARQTKCGTRNNDHLQPAKSSHDKSSIENVHPDERPRGDGYGPMHPKRIERMKDLASSAPQSCTDSRKNAGCAAPFDTAAPSQATKRVQVPKASAHHKINTPKPSNSSARALESGRSESRHQAKSSRKPSGSFHQNRARPDARPSSAKPKTRKGDGPKKHPREHTSTSPDADQPSSGRGSESKPLQIPRGTPRAPALKGVNDKSIRTYATDGKHSIGAYNVHEPFVNIDVAYQTQRHTSRNSISSSANDTIYWSIDMFPDAINKPKHFPDHVLDVSTTWLRLVAELFAEAGGDLTKAFESMRQAMEKRCGRRDVQMCSDDVAKAIKIQAGRNAVEKSGQKSQEKQPADANGTKQENRNQERRQEQSNTNSRSDTVSDENMESAPAEPDAQATTEDAEPFSTSPAPAATGPAEDPMDIDLASAIATPLPPSPKPANASASFDQPPP